MVERYYEYTNQYGEDWIFIYKDQCSINLMKGSDIDWHAYPVIEGQALGLVLNEEERIWLQSVWTDAAMDNTGLYRGLDTEFVIDKQYCSLTNDCCPLCLKKKQNFEYHHCIWSSEGGTSDASNLLRICMSCHAVLTRGSDEDRIPKDLAAFCHQMMYFGLDFIPRTRPHKGKHKNVSFLEEHPWWREPLEQYDAASADRKRKINQLWKDLSRLQYQYYRDIGGETWSWEDHITEKILPIPSHYLFGGG